MQRDLPGVMAPIDLNDLLDSSLLELKEKVSGLSLELSLPAAPLREEIIDLLLDKCFEKVVPLELLESCN